MIIFSKIFKISSLATTSYQEVLEPGFRRGDYNDDFCRSPSGRVFSVTAALQYPGPKLFAAGR
jgi:hypothetical protein